MRIKLYVLSIDISVRSPLRYFALKENVRNIFKHG